MAHYQKILQQYWGYPDFRGIQRQIIESIGEGRDTLGLMPTGGGKSITFQVPALAMRGVCIVVTPLIALMKDQVDHLRARGIKASAVYSGMQREEIVQVLDNAVLGGVTLLYVSPERLSSELFLTKLRHMRVSFITVDEAHCICQWGYDFRPSYLEIAKIRQVKPDAPVLALTATATPETVADIQRQLGFKEENVFRMSFERSNLSYIVRHTDDKMEQLVHILSSTKGSAIIYVRNRQLSKDIATYLQHNGISATHYHAGLDHAVREKSQMEWQKDKIRVMVATNAFGMGIDKPDVRMVLHVAPPDSIEAYFQEAGRAGRDGEKSYAVLLCNNSDIQTLSRRVAENFPDKEYIKTVYEHLAYHFQVGMGSGYNHTFEFDIDRFSYFFKHFPLQVSAAIKILARAGYLDYGINDDGNTRLRFLVGRNDLYRISELSAVENNVITALLRCYSGLFTDYAFIDESLIGQQTGMDRNGVYDILKGLNQKHIIHFIPRRDIPHIRYTQSRVPVDDIIIPRSVYEERRDAYAQRVKAMTDYLQNSLACRSRQLLRYFGETRSADCDHCDVCIGHRHDTPEEKSAVKKTEQQILTMLSDGQPHDIADINTIPEETRLIDQALCNLVYEERVKTAGGKISL